MSEFINVYKRLDLLKWVKNFEEKVDQEIIGSNKEKKEELKKIYQENDNIRKYYFDNYLSNKSDNLNIKSNKDNYSYEYFFKKEPFDFQNKYKTLFKKENKDIDKNTNKNKLEENIKEKNINRNYYDYSKYKRKENINENSNKYINQPKYENFNINNKNENKYEKEYENK